MWYTQWERSSFSLCYEVICALRECDDRWTTFTSSKVWTVTVNTSNNSWRCTTWTHNAVVLLKNTWVVLHKSQLQFMSMICKALRRHVDLLTVCTHTTPPVTDCTRYINGYNHHFQLGIAYLSSSMEWVKVFNPEEQGWCTSVPCLHSTLTTVWPAVFLYSDTSIRLEMKKPPVVACLCLKQKL